MATKVEVEEFLEYARILIEAGRLTFVPRTANIEGMAELGITNREAEAILMRLTSNNYSRGPDDDHDTDESDVWIFGASVEKTMVYIKLKTGAAKNGAYVKCLSFHPAHHELNFPLRPNKPAKK